MKESSSPRRQDARDTLPDELRPIFDEFVADYVYASTKRYGKPYISYAVLADMVRAGWRPSASPLKGK